MPSSRLADGAADAQLKAELAQAAAGLGFARCGVAAARPLVQEGERLRRWLARGFHGEMAYMERAADVRIDPGHPGMLPGVRSVVVLVAPYARHEPAPDLLPGRVARYAAGRDYHNVLHRRLRKLSRWLRERGHETRAAVDSMPVFERAWAARAGVGFIGKNCCLIVPGLGSHVFLACLLTSARLPPDAPISERCGSCRLCLDACPTRAFVAPRELDARRCISYLTIEKRGPHSALESERLGSWLFGCDQCQDVCPFNRTRPLPAEQTAAFAASPKWAGEQAESLLQLDAEGFSERFEGSPLKRAGRAGLARNAASVLGNQGQRRALPILQAAAQSDPAPEVRQSAGRALARLKSEGPAE